MHDKLVIKVNAIDTKIPSTSRLVNKTQNDSGKKDFYKKIEDFDQKISNTSRLFKKTDFSTKFREIKNKPPSVTGLVTTAAQNTKAT